MSYPSSSDPGCDFPESVSPGVAEGPLHSRVPAGTLGSEAQGTEFFLATPSGLEAPQPRVTFCLVPPQVMEELQAASVHSDERELLQLLSTPHLRVVTQSLPARAAHVPRNGGSAGRLRKGEV